MGKQPPHAPAPEDAPWPTRSVTQMATHISGLDDMRHCRRTNGRGRRRSRLRQNDEGHGSAYRHTRDGQPAILLSLEEGEAMICGNALSLGWDRAALEKAGRLPLMHRALPPHPPCAPDRRRHPAGRFPRNQRPRRKKYMNTSIENTTRDRMVNMILFIAGNGPNSARARCNLQKVCEARLKNGYTLDVVDVLEDSRPTDLPAIATAPRGDRRHYRRLERTAGRRRRR